MRNATATTVKYAVQVYVNKRYIDVQASTDLSAAFDKFTAFNRTGDIMAVLSGRSIPTLTDRVTRLVRISPTGKPVVLRKGHTALAA